MKVNEILVEFQPRTTKADVAKMKKINANVQQAMANGDADAGFEAGAELGDMLMNKVYPDMLQVITKMVNELEIACKKYAKDPRWAQACKELPKVKADLKKQRMATYGQGQGRQDVGETTNASSISVAPVAVGNKMQRRNPDGTAMNALDQPANLLGGKKKVKKTRKA